MKKADAIEIITTYCFGATFRRIAEIYATKPELQGNQLEGQDLVLTAIKKLKLKQEKVEVLQEKVLKDRWRLYDRHNKLIAKLLALK